jgi:uncharacterized protein YprB with RNaseH-like and TPR domain
VRRILSDGALEALPLAPAAAIPDAASARTSRLRDRLRALGVHRERTRTEPAAAGPPPTWVEEEDDRPLEAQVGGTVRETPHGTFLYVERRIPLEERHGRYLLADALEHHVALRAHEQGPSGPARLDPADAVFLDTETTGLAGGTGTVAFLIGAGRVEGDGFVVRQYCMRDFPEEAALLHALLEDVGDAPLVTFNGRSFDWPLLVTRLRLHRMDAAPRAHLDLLPPARRIWADSLPSRTLGTLEAHVLGLVRENDLPGWRIPQAYFDYLRTGSGGLVAHAFRHNELDVVSMLALLGCVGAILAAPTRRGRATPRDYMGTARLLLDMGRTKQARHCLETGIDRSLGPEEIPLRRLLGHLCRRARDYDEALAHWSHVARTSPDFDLEAFEEVAKLHEHRRRDFATALAWVEEALGQVTPGSRPEASLRHREARLRRRLEASRDAPGSSPRPRAGDRPTPA